MTSFSVTDTNPELTNVLINILVEGFKTDRTDVYIKLFSFKGINGLYFIPRRFHQTLLFF